MEANDRIVEQALSEIDWTADPLKAAAAFHELAGTHGLGILEDRNGDLQLRAGPRTPLALASVAKAHDQELLRYLRERQV